MVKKGSNQKNKTTLFYETFKVQTIKVVLFFHLRSFGLFFGFEPFLPFFGHFVIFEFFYYINLYDKQK